MELPAYLCGRLWTCMKGEREGYFLSVWYLKNIKET